MRRGALDSGEAAKGGVTAAVATAPEPAYLPRTGVGEVGD